jgi:hypothetical protein
LKLKLEHPPTDYQRRWLFLLDNAKRWAAIIAARGSAKTWTVALWCVRRTTGKKKRQITIVPGGKQAQGSQLFSYIEDILDLNPRARRKIVNWSATRIKFMNGSTITVNPPTKGGVQSARGDIVVDEAHLFPSELGPKMEPIASKAGNRIILIGIPEQPSWFKARWDAIMDKDDSVDWEAAVDGGVIDLDAVMDYKAHNTHDDFLIQYCNKWVLKSEFVFVVPRWPSDKPFNVLGMTCGIDFNPSEGHAWVVSEHDSSDNWRITMAGMTQKGNSGDILTELAIKLSELHALGVRRFIAEGNALNDGYLNHVRTLVPFQIERDEWDEAGKSTSVQRGIVLSQRGKLFDDVGLDWDHVQLDDKGRMVKKVHECDAALHSLKEKGRGMVVSQTRFAREHAKS